MQAVATRRASVTLCSSQIVPCASLPYVTGAALCAASVALTLRNQSTYLKKYAKPTRVSFANLGPSPKLKLSVSLSSQRQIVPLLAKGPVDYASSSVSSSLPKQNVPLAREPEEFVSSSSPSSVSSTSKSSRQAVPLLDKEPEDIASSASSLFGERMPLPFPLGLSRNRSRPMHVKAYRNDQYINSSMDWCEPDPKERPEWFWRILATVPYLLSLKMSEIAFHMGPFLVKHCGDMGETILEYLLPGRANSLNSRLFMVYTSLGYYWLVKNRHLPHFLRFHIIMAMLLDAGMQIFCRTSSLFPLINYKGKLATYHYMVMGVSYACLLLECLRCALAGTNPRIPLFSDAAYSHTLFDLGGWPFDGFFKRKARRFSN